ncbi:3-ketoacyl-CoA thiolase [Geobacillus stearothermophilus]|nr:3-ketoacyl-CoA thiolase [Geobacillus stearothermophilus]
MSKERGLPFFFVPQKRGYNIGRLAALEAGFPVEVPAVQINRMCGSGQQAIHFAA